MTSESDMHAVLRRYVLGELPEDRQRDVEERLLVEQELFQELGPVEDELIEDYLERGLPRGERAAFERRFLAKPENRNRLRHLELLRRRARASAFADVPRAHPRWVLPASLAASIALVLAGSTVWLGVRHRQTAAELTSARAQLETELRARQKLEQQIQTLDARAAAVDSPFSTFTLSGPVLRSEGTVVRISVPSGVQVIRLRLPLSSPPYRSFRVAVHDEQDAEIWTQSGIQLESTDAGPALTALIPASVFSPGDYRVRVAGIPAKGSPEPLATFRFRVGGR